MTTFPSKFQVISAITSDPFVPSSPRTDSLNVYDSDNKMTFKSLVRQKYYSIKLDLPQPPLIAMKLQLLATRIKTWISS